MSLSAVAVSLMLSACGGGGGSTSTPTPPPPVAQTCANGAADYPTCTPAVTPAKLQLTVPAPPYAAGSEDLKAFNYLNDVRQKMGLGLLAYSAELDKASANHANYLELNRVLQHDEDPLKPGFTGINASQQIAFAGYATNYQVGGNVGSANTKTGVMDTFLNSVYHRGSLLKQHYRDVGSATYCLPCDGDVAVNVFVSSKDAGQNNASDFVTFYPMDKQSNVHTSFVESPNVFPVEHPGVYLPFGVVGYPVSFYVEEKQVLNLKTFTMTEAGQTTPLDAFVRTLTNEPVFGGIGANEAYLIAKTPLKFSTTYNIVVTATVNGKDIARNWSFTTGVTNHSF